MGSETEVREADSNLETLIEFARYIVYEQLVYEGHEDRKGDTPALSFKVGDVLDVMKALDAFDKAKETSGDKPRPARDQVPLGEQVARAIDECSFMRPELGEMVFACSVEDVASAAIDVMERHYEARIEAADKMAKALNDFADLRDYEPGVVYGLPAPSSDDELARFHPDNVEWPEAVRRGPAAITVCWHKGYDENMPVLPAAAYRELFEAYCRATGPDEVTVSREDTGQEALSRIKKLADRWEFCELPSLRRASVDLNDALDSEGGRDETNKDPENG